MWSSHIPQDCRCACCCWHLPAVRNPGQVLIWEEKTNFLLLLLLFFCPWDFGWLMLVLMSQRAQWVCALGFVTCWITAFFRGPLKLCHDEASCCYWGGGGACKENTYRSQFLSKVLWDSQEDNNPLGATFPKCFSNMHRNKKSLIKENLNLPGKWYCGWESKKPIPHHWRRQMASSGLKKTHTADALWSCWPSA